MAEKKIQMMGVECLLDVDKEARHMIEEAEQYKQQVLQELAMEKENMQERYAERAKMHIEALEAELANQAAEELATVREKTNALMQAMEDRYDQNHAAWEQALFQACVGGDSR